jgi:ABC-type transport system substrate-binding protein
MTLRSFSAIVLIGLLGLMGFIAPLFLNSNGQSSPAPCPASQTLNWYVPGGTPSGFNFVSSPPTSGFDVARLLYEGFSPFVFGNGTVDYSNAITDNVTHNANYTQWSFNIKPGMKWSNGQPVTANDILATYGPGFGLNASFDVFNLHAEVKQAYAANSSEAVFVLNQSDAHFPDVAGPNQYTGVYPVDFTQHGAAYSGINSTAGSLIGDGPFYLSNYKSGDTQAVFLRNPYYSPEPKICEIIMNFVESDSSDATYLIGGQADFAAIEPGAAASLAGHSNLHILDTKAVDILMLAYNASIYPFNQLPFRQALLYGINQSQIQSQAYNGYDTLAYNAQGGVPPETTAWYTSHQQNYSFNPSQAITLLNSINIKKGSDGYLQYPNSSGNPNGTDITLPIWGDNQRTGGTIATGIIQTDLNNLGFKTTLQIVGVGTLIGDSYQGITSNGLIVFQSGGPVFGLPYLDALPGPQIYNPNAPYPSWEPSAQGTAEYNGNFSIIKTSDVPSIVGPALDNIQSINSQQLPDLILGYPDYLFAYSTSKFTNWPSFMIYGLESAFNNQGFAQLTPVGSSTSTGTGSTLDTTATTTTAANNTLLYAAIAVIVVIIIIAAAVFALRRRPAAPPAPPPPS